jgi:hypothetical protein
VDPFAVEIGNGQLITVFAVGDALCDALVRPGRVVMRLVFSQDGPQMPLADDQHAILWGSITGSGLDGLPGWDHR